MTEQEQQEKLIEDAAVFDEGMHTEFWKRMKKMLDDLREDAIQSLLNAPSDERGLIAELQATAKIGGLIEKKLQDTINYAREICKQ